MRASGIVRRVDNLGRIVIPKEIRKVRGWGHGTVLEMFVDGDAICYREYKQGCHYCGRVNDSNKTVLGVNVCGACVKAIKRAFEE